MRGLAFALLLGACGGGSSSPPAQETTPEPEPEKEAPREEPPLSVEAPTGADECDALVVRTLCVYDKAGDALPADAHVQLADGVAAWRDALQNDVTRQPTIDACLMSLDGGRAGFEATGCWVMGDEFDSYGAPADVERDYTYQSTGNKHCDQLVEQTFCAYEKSGDAVPVAAIEAFRDGIEAWTEALKNDATRQATIDACKMSLEGGKEWFEEIGC